MNSNNIVTHKFIYLLFIVFMLKPVVTFGCTTPVFRYALERWPAFNYTVEIIYNGNLDSEQSEVINQLKISALADARANINVREIKNPIDIAADELPKIRLLYPTEQRNSGILWEGRLTKENINKIVDSPARRELVQRIEQGDAIAWILLKSEDEVKNQIAHNTLNSELEKLSDELKLATSATDADGNLLEIDLINRGVKFSMVSISRDDPAEEIFVKMLLGTEPDLPFIEAPLAFPVFGRGRVLYALVGRGINAKLIKSTCNAVIGWCSCTVKEDNPGSDLLFKADWEKAIGDSTWVEDVELPEITGMAGFINEELVKTDSSKKVPSELPVKQAEVEETREVVSELTLKEETIVNEVEKSIESKEEVVVINKAENTEEGISPLFRNILVTVISLLAALFAVSLYFRKKRSNSW